jgi:hypothetical protein
MFLEQKMFLVFVLEYGENFQTTRTLVETHGNHGENIRESGWVSASAQ